MYLFPLRMVDESNDSPEDLMALSRQVLFDTGAARSVCPTTFRPDVPIETSEEIPLHQAGPSSRNTNRLSTYAASLTSHGRTMLLLSTL